MKKNLLALLVGCALTLALFALAEGFFQLNTSYPWLKPLPKKFFVHEYDEKASKALLEILKSHPIYNWKPRHPQSQSDDLRRQKLELIQDGGLIPCCIATRAPNPAHTFTAKKVISDTKIIVVENTYSMDDFGRRITPQVKDPEAYILMFGDSYTLGEAVNDDQSAPYQLGLMRPKTKVFNFGLAGGSPNEVLLELQKNPAGRIQALGQAPTTVLYTFMDNHLERLFCRSICLSPVQDWSLPGPYYDWENGKVVFKGTFESNRKLTNFFYKIISSSSLLQYFSVVWPLYFSEKHYEFFAEIILSAKTRSQELYPGSEFFMVLYPQASAHYGRVLRAAAEKRGIKVLDYSSISVVIATNGNDQIPGDGHPSPITQYLFAWLLNRDLHVVPRR